MVRGDLTFFSRRRHAAIESPANEDFLVKMFVRILRKYFRETNFKKNNIAKKILQKPQVFQLQQIIAPKNFLRTLTFFLKTDKGNILRKKVKIRENYKLDLLSQGTLLSTRWGLKTPWKPKISLLQWRGGGFAFPFTPAQVSNYNSLLDVYF